MRGLYPREGRRAGRSHPLTAVPAPHAVPTHPGPEARVPWGHREAPPRGLQEQREPRMGGSHPPRRHSHPGSSVGCPAHARPAHASPAAGVHSGAGMQLHSPVWGPSRSRVPRSGLPQAGTVWRGTGGSHRPSAAGSIPRGCKGGTGSRPRGTERGLRDREPRFLSVSQQLVSASNTWHLSLHMNVT